MSMRVGGAGLARCAGSWQALLIACLLACCALLAGCSSSGVSSSSESSDSLMADVSDLSAPSDALSLGELVPFEVEGLDWDPATLADAQARNSDVYAWLYVPGTGVYHPLLQNKDDEDFYLSHDIDGNYSDTGELYSQSTYNSTDFKDPVTLIYGHTFEPYSGLGEEMFSTLHNFEDKDFFDSHRYFYVFTPDMVLRYQVVSAYVYENRHVLYGNDFTKESVLQSYFDYVVNPDSSVKNVLEGAHLKAGKNRIIQLATCTRPANDDYRYLVTGVLDGGRPL